MRRPFKYCMKKATVPIQSLACGFSAVGKMMASIGIRRPTRAGDNSVEFLQGFKGYLMCDGYIGYNKVPDAKKNSLPCRA